MKIMIISRGVPDSKYKLNGIFEYDQAKALVKKGCDVIYLALDTRSLRRWRRWGFVHKIEDGMNIFMVNVPLGNIPHIVKNRMASFALKKLYDRAVKKCGESDLIHSHFFDISYITAKALKNEKIPLVITEHSSVLIKENIPIHLFNMAKYAYIKARLIITVSSSLQRILYEKFNIDAVHVPNIVDLDIFDGSKWEEHKGFNFISVANLKKNKRLDLVIASFSQLRKEYNDISLMICGEGKERRNLKVLIERHDLKNDVILKGLCSREEIAKLLCMADCFVLPSQGETFGVAYIESLSMGVPVIATRCGGPEDFVNNDNGILIEIDNQKTLTKEMLNMYKNANKYKRDEVAKAIRDKFSPEEVANHLIKHYHLILDKEREV